MPSLNKNLSKTKNLYKTKNLFPPPRAPPVQAAAASKPPLPPRTPFAPWELVHLPHPPAPAPQGAGEARGRKTIEPTTTQREEPDHHTHPTHTDETHDNEEKAWEESEAPGLPVRDGRPGAGSLLLSPCSS